MTRLRPEGAEQDTLDQEIKIATSTLSLNEDNVDQGCLPFKCLAGNTNNITLDSRRKPISTLAGMYHNNNKRILRYIGSLTNYLLST